MYRFFVFVNPFNSEIMSLWRKVITNDGRELLERLDTLSGQWQDDPGLIAYTGQGGDNHFIEVAPEMAEKLYEDMMKGKTVKAVFRPKAPKGQTGEIMQIIGDGSRGDDTEFWKEELTPEIEDALYQQVHGKKTE